MYSFDASLMQIVQAAEDEESGEDFTKDIDNVPAVSDEEEEEQEEEPKPKKKTPAKKATALKRKAPAKTKVCFTSCSLAEPISYYDRMKMKMLKWLMVLRVIPKKAPARKEKLVLRIATR